MPKLLCHHRYIIELDNQKTLQSYKTLWKSAHQRHQTVNSCFIESKLQSYISIMHSTTLAINSIENLKQSFSIFMHRHHQAWSITADVLWISHQSELSKTWQTLSFTARCSVWWIFLSCHSHLWCHHKLSSFQEQHSHLSSAIIAVTVFLYVLIQCVQHSKLYLLIFYTSSVCCTLFLLTIALLLQPYPKDSHMN